MVVASGGWVQNASFSTGQNNTNLTQNQNNKMTAKGILICRDNSHPFQERTLTLEQPVKIGRSVARARCAANNAIFDCKVLSRNHALLWYCGGKFYLQDTRSSNGTFINNQRLSASGLESTPREVCSGDIVQFGVDVVENTKKVTHGCIIATLKLYLPDGKEAKASLSTSVSSPVDNVSFEDLYKLHQIIQEASRREKTLYTKLCYLQQLVENTTKATNQSWKALIAEDRLLSWVETIESQLAIYSKNYTEDKIRNELVKLHEEKAQYQNAAKEAVQKILLEKLEVTQKLVRVEGRLSETEEECQSLHNVAKYTQTELQELSSKYTEMQKKLQEATDKLMESEEKMKEIKQNSDREKSELLRKLETQWFIEEDLQARLRDSRLDSVNIAKQITALRNYMQTLQDRYSKLELDEMVDSKDEENPIEAINIILNRLNSIPLDNSDKVVHIGSDLDSAENEQDNQINSQDIDTNHLKTVNSNDSYCKEHGSLLHDDNLTEYILPPPSRKTLINGNANLDNTCVSIESNIVSDVTKDTCSSTSDDADEKSVLEVKTEEEHVPDIIKEAHTPHKPEVHFALNENGEQLEVHYVSYDSISMEEHSIIGNKADIPVLSDESKCATTKERKESDEENEVQEVSMDDPEEEHLEGDYIKTLKPLPKSDTIQQSLHSREYILQTLIKSLDSLNGEDSLEAQQIVKSELEALRDWLTSEPSETIIDKLKELYYRVKNETQKIQEVNEELVILKEKYNAFVEEKAELSKKYMTLKAQCGDLLNTTYSVPIHYVAPIAIALVWMLLEKIF